MLGLKRIIKLKLLDHLSLHERLGREDIREKTYSREYPNVQPDHLFMVLVEILKNSDPFKVWNVDEKGRIIDMTTYPQLLGVTNRREQVDVSVLEGKDSNLSTVQVKITPATAAEQFTMVDSFLRRKGIVESRADSIARMIFQELDSKIGTFGILG